MSRGPLAALLLFACAAGAQAPEFDDSHIRVYYQPQNLWRTERGAFVGRREGRQIVLVYDFFDEGDQYSSCPSKKGASTCSQYRQAVGEALEMWGEASGVLSLRRREASSEPVNIWIAWVDYGGRGPVGQARDNQRSIDGPEPGEAVKNFSGFRNVAYPGEKKSSSALFFNQRYCWHLGDKGECEPPPATPSGKVPEYQFDARTVALHEGGHVMGFGHFTNDSIMGHSGGTGRYELTAYDREAMRRLYERVAASVPLQ